MLTKRNFGLVLIAVVTLFGLAIALRSAEAAPRNEASAAPMGPVAGALIPYAGRLAYRSGGPSADGNYDFAFALYDVENAGSARWSETQQNVRVEGGAFAVMLGSANAVPLALTRAGPHWLAVSVRGPGDNQFAELTPRQQVNTGTPVSAAPPADAANCPPNFGGTWAGSTTSPGLTIVNDASWALAATSLKTGSIAISAMADGQGVFGRALSTTGLSMGVRGQAQSPVGYGGYFENNGKGVGLYVINNADNGHTVAALHAENTAASGGMAGDFKNYSNFHTANFTNAGTGGILYLSNAGADGAGSGGNDFITAVNKVGQQFRVDTAGGVHSRGGWIGWPDFAEMMSTQGAPTNFEPGDVLVVSAEIDRTVALASEPYSTLVMGVYSTKPGMIGTEDVMADSQGNQIPVAIVGIVPTKVSAENGSIRRGDLLVTSSTPGHAMKGTNPLPGTVVGKALGTLESGTGVIQILVTLQ